MRWMLEAKVAATIRPGASRKILSNELTRSRSEPLWPARSALVESLSSSRTPSWPSWRKRLRSVGAPIGGSSSSLKSPVYTIFPTGVLIARAAASGMLW